MAADEPFRPFGRKGEGNDGSPAPARPTLGLTPAAPAPPPAAPPVPEAAKAEPRGPAKLTKKQKKIIKDNHRRLDSWERYRALTDVLDEALELVDLADHKARFALIIMTAINAVILLLGARTDVVRELPAIVRPFIVVGFVLYVLTALYFFFMAIESLRPRKSQPHVRYEGADGLGDHPMGIRFYEDILSRDVEAYRRAWREIKIGQLNAELAVQAHALAEINRAKYNALRKLYQGLQIMIVMGVLLLALAALAYVAANGTEGILSKHSKGKEKAAQLTSPEQGTPARDWSQYPAVVERTTTAQIVGLGDVHGAYERLVALLLKGGLIRKTDEAPGYAWAGGDRLLVCTGDIINKGDHAIEALDLILSLEKQARDAGGEVIVTLGNNEAEFLAKPGKEKAEEFRTELERKGLDGDAVADGATPYGIWLHQRPLAAKVNGWFFVHAGHTGGQSVQQIADGYRKVVDAAKWKSKSLIGPDSMIEAEKWWEDRPGIDRDLAGLGAAHIVFGHDPGAFKEGQIVEKYGGRIFRIDVGMTPSVNYSKGALLLIDRQGGEEVATSLDADGNRIQLWRGPLRS